MRDSRIAALLLDEYKPLRDIVFESLREAITNQVLKPGERLLENDLAEEMGVSRTPIREAMHKLEQEGLISIIPRKGAFVTQISLQDIKEIYEIRSTLESLASGLTAERATLEEIEEMQRCLVREAGFLNSEDITATVNEDICLHGMIYKAARNDRLLNTLDNLREQIYRMRFAVTMQPIWKKKSLEMHKRLVEAISGRDIEEAQNLARSHIDDAWEAIVEFHSTKIGKDKLHYTYRN
ncbi:MAG: GntR family transcriptional regulator [Firmicutes bacterium HGW-Firmicutes-12]|nr:MAG: GntR family transcriptional regulator [Firmicutes bacterium HGW-Firmicutes-12]